MTTELLFNEPFSGTVQSTALHSADEVEPFAADLLARYQAVGDIVPGIELRHDGGESLSIAVALFGWALLHTDANLDQHCTRNPDTPSDEAHDVRWEEPTSLPRGWFVPTPLAVEAVRTWLTDGSLSADLIWCDDCA
jgi:hypothetical protein